MRIIVNIDSYYNHFLQTLTNFRPSTITAEDNNLSNDRSGHDLLSVDGPFDENEFIGMGKMVRYLFLCLLRPSPVSLTPFFQLIIMY